MFNYLSNNEIYKNIVNAINYNLSHILIKNICNTGKIYFSSMLDNNQKLIVLRDEKSAIKFYEDYKFYDKDVYYFAENDLLFHNANIENDNIQRNRYEIVKRIQNNEKITVISTISSILEKLPSISLYEKDILGIKVNDEYDFDSFINKIIEMGYERNYDIENKFDMTVRGCIVDLYDEFYKNPMRIEFFSDKIESIRYFNIDTKISIENINSINIHPKKIINVNEIQADDVKSLIDYFDEKVLIFVDEPQRIVEKCNDLKELETQSIEQRKEYNDNVLNDELYLLPLYDSEFILNKLNDKSVIMFSNLDDELSGNNLLFNNKQSFYYSISAPLIDKKAETNLANDIKKYLDVGYKGIIVLKSGLTAERLVNDFLLENIKAYYDKNINIEIPIGNLLITTNELSNGFIDEESKFFIFTENDLFGIEYARKNRVVRHNKKVNDNYNDITSLSSIKIGDYIVHEQYGIGIYKGITRLESDKVFKDYITIEYADNGVLYILATKLETVQKYASKNAKLPKLNKLSNNDFYKTKLKVKEEVLNIAKDLIELYAKRQSKSGYRFQKDTIWQKEFEEIFPYVETDDQLKAIEQIKNDMESDKSMDRLVCGDVGFGKTELALRASFKAVQDSKQVALLVPTTILCMQHYKTFTERFKSYPVRIDYLSRFKTSKENKETIDRLKNGKIDIIIGTHRLISKDIEFYDLGLLIIDEEQRFGVSHKEKIKRIKNNVDVLTLSATPIPRTLYMSLSGIRDLSLLTQAPPERVPIKTYVFKYNKELIREAIDNELKREGQVYIIHNKVYDIYEFAEQIKDICKNDDVHIAVIHGKLDENELSKTMDLFINKKINVLITTTIIETGIDIQNANTLIVDSAENFGLAQLYQLRGRVGRSERTAYAFFLYGNDKNLTSESEKRLQAIKEFKSLGSGIKIAMRDLEIRGAGNVLGLSQSGHIDAVGYELYMKLLNKALKYVKEDNKNDENFIDSYDTIVDVDIDAYITDDYEKSEQKRVELYKKISDCQSNEDFDILYDEIKDQYGYITKELDNLFFIAKLKLKAKDVYITELNIKKNSIKITFYEKAKINPNSIVKVVGVFDGNIKFMNGQKSSLYYYDKYDINSNVEKMLKITNDIITNLSVLS